MSVELQKGEGAKGISSLNSSAKRKEKKKKILKRGRKKGQGE